MGKSRQHKLAPFAHDIYRKLAHYWRIGTTTAVRGQRIQKIAAAKTMSSHCRVPVTGWRQVTYQAKHKIASLAEHASNAAGWFI